MRAALPFMRLPLVAILRGIRPDEVLAHATALVDAGFDCIEVPTNSPGWDDSVRTLVQHFGPRVLVGAGTVLNTAHLDALEAAGGRLVVCPHSDPLLIEQAVRRGFCCLPGALTPSEVFAAAQAGAHAVKLFPVGSLGVPHVKALRAVVPAGLPLLAVGGVAPHNLADYLRAGCQGAGLGGELYRAGQAPDITSHQARAFVQAYHSHLQAS